MSDAHGGNEVGQSPPRGRPRIPNAQAERDLSRVAGKEIRLGDNMRATGGPRTCPACGSPRIMWGCDQEQTKLREEIHPLVWHETQRLADSFICRDCWAGWIEPDDPEPFTWVRPYWRV